MRIALVFLVTAILVQAQIVTKNEKLGGTMLTYKVILPKGYDPAKEYPAVIAFPGGAQTLPMVDGMIARNFRLEADKRGYIVAVAAAPAEGLFFEGGARVFPEFLEKLLADYKIRGRKFHIAGISNGGISAFHIAASFPQYFWSVTGFPGYLPDATPKRQEGLAGMCLYMHVGEMDAGWVGAMRAQAEEFRAQGKKVSFEIERGQGHVMRTLEGDGAGRLFEHFEACTG